MLKFISRLYKKDKPEQLDEEIDQAKIYVRFNGQMYVKPNEFMRQKSVQEDLRRLSKKIEESEYFLSGR